MAADRIRLGEADVMIAGGTESMSMIPMGGNKIAINERDLRRATRTSASPTAWASPPRRWPQQWKVSREEQDAFAPRAIARRSRRTKRASSTPRSRRI